MSDRREDDIPPRAEGLVKMGIIALTIVFVSAVAGMTWGCVSREGSYMTECVKAHLPAECKAAAP